MKVVSLFLPEIKEFLEIRDFRSVRRLLGDINPVDLAEGFAGFKPQEQAAIFRLLPRRKAAQLFEELEPSEQQALLTHLREVDIKELVTDLDPSETAGLSRDLPPALTRKLFAFMKKDSARQVEALLDFPEDSVGSLMRTRFVALKPGMTCSRAIEHIQVTTRLRQIDNTYLENLFVTDDNERWLGHVPLRVLVVAPRDMLVSELLRHAPRYLTPEQDKEEASNLFRKYKLNSAPVLDKEHRLLGIVLVRDVITVMEEEVEEDIQKLGGMEALDEPYFKISFTNMIKKRATWLCVLFLGEMLTATAMAYFEEEIAKAVVLALFIPLLISSGGNSGSQAATLIVRALALGEVTFSEWWKVAKRELAAGLVLGLILGSIGFLRIAAWSQISPIYGPHYMGVAATVGFSLVGIVLLGTLAGSLLPLGLRRIGLDPAVVSAPFVATLVDVAGLVIYFTVALFFLKGTLL